MRAVLSVVGAVWFGVLLYGCGSFWADDPSAPTDLVHDPLQGGTMNNSSQEHPMFMHGDAAVFQSYDAGALDSLGAARSVVDAVVTP